MIRIFLSINNGAEVLELPVIPSEFQISSSQKDEIFETVSGEELAFIDAAGLTGIAWSSFFPSKDYPFLRCKRLSNVWQYKDKLEGWIDRKYPIRLVISDTPINLATKVTSLDYRMGPDGDLYYDIAFKEFPLVDTESEDLTMTQYEELLAKIQELELKIDNMSGGTVIDSVSDAEVYYRETLEMLLQKTYLTGTDGGLDLTEDMARVLTIVNRANGFHTGVIYNYLDSNIPAEYQESVTWYVTNGYLKGDENGELGLTTDMMRILKVFYDVLKEKGVIS